MGQLCDLEIPFSVAVEILEQFKEKSEKKEEVKQLRSQLKTISLRANTLRQEQQYLKELLTAGIFAFLTTAEEEEKGFAQDYHRLKEKAAAYSANLPEASPVSSPKESKRSLPFRKSPSSPDSGFVTPVTSPSKTRSGVK